MHLNDLKKVVGRHIIVGIEGRSIDASLKSWIEEFEPAGFILFKRNYENPLQVAELCKQLHALYPPDLPPIISVDQEGGRVSRFADPFIQLPSASHFGDHYSQSTSDKDLKAQVNTLTNQLGAVGINLNFVPVLDVRTNLNNKVLGVDRTFSDDPDIVAHLGNVWIEMLQRRGFWACAKHFPGHGDPDLDSHVDLPVYEHAFDRLREIELKPFRAAIHNQVASVMMAHVLYPCIDEEHPASLSCAITHDLLRKQLGFAGVIISDDLGMYAVRDRYIEQEVAMRALQAGNDLLIISMTDLKGTYEHAYGFNVIEGLLGQLEKGTLQLDTLNLSHARVIQHKQKYFYPYKPDNIESMLQDLF